jgi:hypothetical protein
MKKFMAIYLGTMENLEEWRAQSEQKRKELEQKGMAAWMAWGEKNSKSIRDNGGPLGKTKRVDRRGVSDVRNAMTGYTIIEAESADAAAKLFQGHPHFTIFPGDAVEIMEILPIPSM